MVPKHRKILILFFIVAAVTFPDSLFHRFPSAYALEDKKVDQAIWLYQRENYEEALVALKALREERPRSAIVAYYLGITCKQLQDFLEARVHLEAAATLKPRAENAIPELIDVLYQSGEIEEAKKWIELAERESINPAQTSFYKGLVLMNEGGSPDEAIRAFEEAERLDESLAQSARYYKGLVYMQSKNLRSAKATFTEIVVQDPTSDLAEFANEYMDILEKREKETRPFGGSIGFDIQYDDNVILKPDDAGLTAGVSDENDWRQVYTAEGEFNFRINKNFGARTVYSFYGTKMSDLGFYDTMSHDFALRPAFYLENATIGFPMHYNYVTINDKKYLETIGVSNLDNVMIGEDLMLQLMLQMNFDDYNWPVSTDNDDRDGREYLWSAGGFYFFTKDKTGFINLRYSMNYEDTKGNNWTYAGNRVTASATAPIMKKAKWSVAADYFNQNFKKRHTTYDKDRVDYVFTLSNFISYDIFDDIEVHFQHTYVNDSASIGIYNYRRNIYSVGVKWEF